MNSVNNPSPLFLPSSAQYDEHTSALPRHKGSLSLFFFFPSLLWLTWWMSRRRLLSSQPPPPSFSSPHSVHRNYSNSQFAQRIFHVSADWLMLWLTRPHSFFFFFPFLLPLTSWHQALIQRRDKWETSRGGATSQQPPDSPTDFLFCIILRLSRLFCEKLFLIMFPSRVSLSDVLSGGFLAGLAFQSFPWQLSHKKTSHIYLFYFIYEAPKAKRSEKSAERETGNMWRKKKRRDKNTEQSHDGSGWKTADEWKNPNETNQNREKDPIRADDVFAESEGFVSHVHLVKSIFHRSSCERKCM